MAEIYYDSPRTGEELDAAFSKLATIDQSVQQAEQSAADAKTQAKAAASSAAAAAGSSSDAQTQASQAQQQAAAASRSAGDAADSATTAQQKAENAAAQATAASQSADAAAQSAQDAAASVAGIQDDVAQSAENARSAAASAEAAASDATRAEEAAQRAEQIADFDPSKFATAEQGAKADTAVQPEDLGNYALKSEVPSAPADIGAATAAQGAKADTALQPGALNGYALKSDIPQSPADLGAATAAQGAKADTAVQPADLAGYAKASDIPDELPNPNALTLQLNGSPQPSYDGRYARTVNITPGAIGAATSAQGARADTALQPGALNGYAQTSDIPSKLPNPQSLGIRLGQYGSTTYYDGSAAKTVTITPESIGAQPSGSSDYMQRKTYDPQSKNRDIFAYPSHLYKATFLLDNWSSSSPYTQTVSVKAVDGGPAITPQSHMTTGLLIDDTLPDDTIDAIQEAARLIDNGRKTFGSGTITCVLRGDKPDTDVEIFFNATNRPTT